MTTASLAAARLDWAQRQLAECRLCPRDCRVNRAAGETGYCGAGPDARVFTEFVHYGEEAELSPSHTIYLTGCNLRCAFCQTADERRDRAGEALTADSLRAIVARGRSEGARNLNLLGGEPTANLPALLRLLAEVEGLPPIVWNTNLYCTTEALAMVAGIPAVTLADLKFGNAACASGLCGADDYWDVVRARLKEVWEREGGRLVVRHLVLPGHVECCTRPALEWLADELGRVRVSLKTDYVVVPAARGHGELGRFLSEEETRQAGAIADELDIQRVPQARPEDALRMASANAASSDVDAELVISPKGEVFLRHPTREMTAAALAASHHDEEHRQ